MTEGEGSSAPPARAIGRTVLFLAAGALLPSVPALAQPSQTAVVHVYAEDAGAAPVAAQLSEAMVKRATASGGWRVKTDKTVGDLLERAPDDLARAADALASARERYAEGLEHNTRLRLELAQETLSRARAAYLDAAVAPAYDELRNVHLYQGIIYFNQGNQDAAAQQFRQAAFLAPTLKLNRDVFSPSVVAAFELAKRGVSSGPKGALRITSETPGAMIALDGVVKGSAPRLLTDVPEGEHYLEVRAPGAVPQLRAVQVLTNSETPISITLRKADAPLEDVWEEGKGEDGGVAIARILQVDRLVLASVRTTVAGMLPYTARAAAFEAQSGRRFADAETGLAGANDTRVPRFIDSLFDKPQVAVAGRAAIVASRARFMERDQVMVEVETGFAYQNKVFDEKGRYVSSDTWGEFERFSPDQDFERYFETRTALHVRYGMRDRVTATLTLPFYTKELHYTFDRNNNGTIEGSEDDVKRENSGMGDVVLGADFRVPRFEVGPLSMSWVSTRVELPTGPSTEECGFIRRYCTLIMGSGQWDVYVGLGGLVARDDFRFGFEAGYNARIPDRVWYHSVQRPYRHLNPGDEQRLHLDGAMHVGRWLAPEVFLDFVHRNATEDFVNPVTHELGKAPEMFLADLGVAVRAEFSEKSRGGVVVQHPLWGKTTMTFFPLDVTGPRAYLYYGYRF